ncbi:MAG: hypothetical protein NZ898_02820 [Myxococcota bacterium]|nr:hypothetical protein [Myxococcota bacterium]MDW8361306.1 hypothetical protein [Myxococcales bacterium]
MRVAGLRGLAALLVSLTTVACGRSPLRSARRAEVPPHGPHADAAPGATDVGLDAPLDGTEADGPAARCVPAPETCNGRDDDCDGRVDELPPEPCPGGGLRLCVAGRMSACAVACRLCEPGSERVCFLSYCYYWGRQTCAADGRSFGRCREIDREEIPERCIDVAFEHRDSPELQRCCIETGGCCHDRFDLDADGDRGESIGACDGVTCGS